MCEFESHWEHYIRLLAKVRQEAFLQEAKARKIDVFLTRNDYFFSFARSLLKIPFDFGVNFCSCSPMGRGCYLKSKSSLCVSSSLTGSIKTGSCGAIGRRGRLKICFLMWVRVPPGAFSGCSAAW